MPTYHSPVRRPYNAVADALARLGFRRAVSPVAADLLIPRSQDVHLAESHGLPAGRTLMALPGGLAINDKARLWRALRTRFGDTVPSWIPETFDPADPGEATRLADQPPDAWILKPPRGWDKRGIELVNGPGAAALFRARESGAIVQRLVRDPMLVAHPFYGDGVKHNLRVWVLLTGEPGGPLTAWLHRLHRVSYAGAPYRRGDPGAEVTSGWDRGDGMPSTVDGFLAADQVDRLWVQLADRVRTVLSATPAEVGAGCPEHRLARVTGWDFLIDAHGEVHFIELNTKPHLGYTRPDIDVVDTSDGRPVQAKSRVFEDAVRVAFGMGHGFACLGPVIP